MAHEVSNHPSGTDTDIGLVIIGRNEGERLKRCLESVVEFAPGAVYVDSGSTDGSTDLAKRMHVEVVELDMSIPFSAARARNAGFQRLKQMAPQARYVQFVDGDCQLASGWLAAAQAHLDAHDDLAVVAGRLREVDRTGSIYNRLADMEWDEPVGPVDHVGGIFMVRADAFDQVGGFDASVVAGEEPELCVRLRRAGGGIERLDAEMGWHDAAITRFGQWWKRQIRNGWAFASGASMHGRSPESHRLRQWRSVWLWSVVVPLVTMMAALLTHGWGALLLLAYPLMVVRIAVHRRRRGDTLGDALLYGVFCMLGKFPEAIGQLRYLYGRRSGNRSALIEYKTPAKSTSVRQGH